MLYQGHLSEIFVPYMDPSRHWYARNFLDAGEYSAGCLPDPLEPGVDCPSNAAYFDMLVAQDNGRPRDKRRTACVFERYAGDMSWRHGGDERPDGWPKRDVVARMIARLGPYDYVFDWVFQTDGTLRVAVGLTGIAQVKMVAERNAHEKPRGPSRADAYGRFIAEHLVATNHDHFLSFRLDLDVDGMRNRFVRDRLKTVEPPHTEPRRSLWMVEQSVAQREQDAQSQMDMRQPSLWRVLNPAVTNDVGYPVSYQLMPGMTAHTLLTPEDYPRRRAGFIDHHLWVTPYRAAERYAAGDYPVLSKPRQGLPERTRANRSIADTDIVLWYTVGMHHVVCAEDWPVMPVLWHSFELKPFDFFDANPALDLNRQP